MSLSRYNFVSAYQGQAEFSDQAIYNVR